MNRRKHWTVSWECSLNCPVNRPPHTLEQPKEKITQKLKSFFSFPPRIPRYQCYYANFPTKREWQHHRNSSSDLNVGLTNDLAIIWARSETVRGRGGGASLIRYIQAQCLYHNNMGSVGRDSGIVYLIQKNCKKKMNKTLPYCLGFWRNQLKGRCILGDPGADSGAKTFPRPLYLPLGLRGWGRWADFF